ncbi:DUF4286 family protein [Massilia horti]|uniref:Uncharacterized protein n=1 Tax=Massilia horti TaxID=2562153 RepID=A0A4Y9T5R2_9BURK|nr:DUF4286 family protein [Massilia horti]TFW35649.1 hypothetical protein E4O92_01445 [Massilia horti]
MSDKQAVLMVLMEPPATHEDEFNDWYDTEHFPQRCALPGFASGSRWVCLDGWPRWLAHYDLESVDVLASDAYRAVSGPNSTPWSRRMLARAIGRCRIVAHASGMAAGPLATTAAARLLLAGYQTSSPAHAHELAVAAATTLRVHPHHLDTRVYLEQRDAGVTVWSVTLFRAVVHNPELAALAGCIHGVGATTFNLYGRYHRA